MSKLYRDHYDNNLVLNCREEAMIDDKRSAFSNNCSAINTSSEAQNPFLSGGESESIPRIIFIPMLNQKTSYRGIKNSYSVLAMTTDENDVIRSYVHYKEWSTVGLCEFFISRRLENINDIEWFQENPNWNLIEQ